MAASQSQPQCWCWRSLCSSPGTQRAVQPARSPSGIIILILDLVACSTYRHADYSYKKKIGAGELLQLSYLMC